MALKSDLRSLLILVDWKYLQALIDSWVEAREKVSIDREVILVTWNGE